MKNLIDHYKEFYEYEGGTLDTFCDWCRFNSDPYAFDKFAVDILDNHNKETLTEEEASYVYGLIKSAGMVANAYEYLRFDQGDESFKNFYQCRFNLFKGHFWHQYEETYGFLPSKDLEEKAIRKVFRMGYKKALYIHSVDVLYFIQTLYKASK